MSQHVALPSEGSAKEEATALVQVADTPQERWSVVKHTQASCTDAYGILEFQGGHANKAMVQSKDISCSVFFYQYLAHTHIIIIYIFYHHYGMMMIMMMIIYHFYGIELEVF